MLVQIISIALGLAIISLFSPSAVAQNWHQSNPDQPNGYHASEFESHYHGNLEAPANQQNGYRASEARSHYGGSRFEPSNGWSYQDSSTPGSAFSNQSNEGGGIGSAYSNASWYQNGGSQNSFMDRMRRSNRWQGAYQHLAAAGYVPGGDGQQSTSYGASQSPTGFQSFRSRLSTFEPLIQREQSWRQRETENVEDGHGGFNTIYAQ